MLGRLLNPAFPFLCVNKVVKSEYKEELRPFGSMTNYTLIWLYWGTDEDYKRKFVKPVSCTILVITLKLPVKGPLSSSVAAPIAHACPLFNLLASPRPFLRIGKMSLKKVIRVQVRAL